MRYNINTKYASHILIWCGCGRGMTEKEWGANGSSCDKCGSNIRHAEVYQDSVKLNNIPKPQLVK